MSENQRYLAQIAFDRQKSSIQFGHLADVAKNVFYELRGLNLFSFDLRNSAVVGGAAPKSLCALPTSNSWKSINFRTIAGSYASAAIRKAALQSNKECRDRHYNSIKTLLDTMNPSWIIVSRDIGKRYDNKSCLDKNLTKSNVIQLSDIAYNGTRAFVYCISSNYLDIAGNGDTKRADFVIGGRSPIMISSNLPFITSASENERPLLMSNFNVFVDTKYIMTIYSY